MRSPHDRDRRRKIVPPRSQPGGTAAKEFRLPGTEVRVSCVGRGVSLEPIERDAADIHAIFAKLTKYRDIPFMEEGRQQQPMPPSGDVSLD